MMTKKTVNIPDTYIQKPVPVYTPPTKLNQKKTKYSLWFNNKKSKYLSLHINKIDLKKFKIKLSIQILIYVVLLFVFLFICMFHFDDNKFNKSLNLSMTIIAAILTLITLFLFLVQSIYTCVFFHKSFDLFVENRKFNDSDYLKSLPIHTIKYLYQYGLVDKEIYEIIKKAKKE